MMLEYVDDTEIRLWFNEEYRLPYYEITKNEDGSFAIRCCSVSEFAPVDFKAPDLEKVREEILADVSKEICYQLAGPEVREFFGIPEPNESAATPLPR